MNNSETAPNRHLPIPTAPSGVFLRVRERSDSGARRSDGSMHGDGAAAVRRRVRGFRTRCRGRGSTGDHVQVPSGATIATPMGETHSRMQVSATSPDRRSMRSRSRRRIGNEQWQTIGTDDNAPYQVFHDVSGLDARHAAPVPRGGARQPRPHGDQPGSRDIAVPSPAVWITEPGRRRHRRTTVDSQGDDRSGTGNTVGHLRAQRRRRTRGSPSAPTISSPEYTVTDDLRPLGTGSGNGRRYRAVLPNRVRRPSSTSETVTVAAAFADDATCRHPRPYRRGRLQFSEIGCAALVTGLPASTDDVLTRTTASSSSPSTYPLAATTSRPPTTGRGTRTTAGASPNGSNITFTPSGGPVTFYYDHRTHWITNDGARARSSPCPVVISRNSAVHRIGCLSACGRGCRTPTPTARTSGDAPTSPPETTRPRSPTTCRGTRTTAPAVHPDGGQRHRSRSRRRGDDDVLVRHRHARAEGQLRLTPASCGQDNRRARSRTTGGERLRTRS